MAPLSKQRVHRASGGQSRFEGRSLLHVSDWRKAGHVVRCWDFSAVVGKRNGLKFVSLLLKPVLDCNEAIAIKEPEPSIVG